MTQQAKSTSTPLARWARVGAHLGILALALVLLRDVVGITSGRLWPDRAFPILIVALAAFTAIASLMREILSQQADWGENPVRDLDTRNRVRLLSFGLVWLAFALALPRVGFLLSAIVALTASGIIIARARWWLALPVAILCTLGIWTLFQRYLFVSLPLGAAELLLLDIENWF